MRNDHKNPYQILKVKPTATLEEIKSAYRTLVKKWHPDTGGDKKLAIELNAAWEILKDKKKRAEFDSLQQALNNQEIEDYKENISKSEHRSGSELEIQVTNWINKVYLPVDRLLGQIVNTFQAEITKLSADPYDDILMESFCIYIEKSKHKAHKIKEIYTSLASPKIINSFSLNLYQCLSEVQDGIRELEIYTMGYVDSYLHDGKEMLREAKKKRAQLHQEKKQLSFSKK